MTSVQPPPIAENVADSVGKATIPYILFFNQIYEGDTGNAWTPTFQGLTVVTPPTITATYYRILRRLCFFRVTLNTPANTSAVAGTTYIDNFPLNFAADGVCFAVTGNLGSPSGHVVAANKRIYVPTWTGVTVPLTIVGVCEVTA